MTLTQYHADLMHAVLGILDDGPRTFGQLSRELADHNQHDLTRRPTPSDLGHVLEHMEGVCLIECAEHDDARAREGGAPAEYALCG